MTPPGGDRWRLAELRAMLAGLPLRVPRRVQRADYRARLRVRAEANYRDAAPVGGLCRGSRPPIPPGGIS